MCIRDRSSRADGLRLSSLKQKDGELAPFSITPEQWGNFLCTIFDEWVLNDVGNYLSLIHILSDTRSHIYGGRLNDVSFTVNYYINKYMIWRFQMCIRDRYQPFDSRCG